MLVPFAPKATVANQNVIRRFVPRQTSRVRLEPVGVLFPELIPMPHTRELMRARARLAKSLTLLPAASACRHLH